MAKRGKPHQRALDWVFAHVFAPCFAFVLHLFCRTFRWEVRGLEHLEPYWQGERPVIVGCWHGRLIMIPYVWYKHGRGETYVLMGRNRNGELITRIVAKFRMQAVRGGSRKGGEEARQEMEARVLADPHTTLSMTPDGPHGPRFVSKMGMAHLSRKLDVPIIWVSACASRSYRFPTWDRFMFPLPFSRVVAEFSAPIFPRDHAAKSLEEYHAFIDARGREYLRAIDEEVAGVAPEDRALLEDPALSA